MPSQQDRYRVFGSQSSLHAAPRSVAGISAFILDERIESGPGDVQYEALGRTVLGGKGLLRNYAGKRHDFQNLASSGKRGQEHLFGENILTVESVAANLCLQRATHDGCVAFLFCDGFRMEASAESAVQSLRIAPGLMERARLTNWLECSSAACRDICSESATPILPHKTRRTCPIVYPRRRPVSRETHPQQTPKQQQPTIR